MEGTRIATHKAHDTRTRTRAAGSGGEGSVGEALLDRVLAGAPQAAADPDADAYADDDDDASLRTDPVASKHRHLETQQQLSQGRPDGQSKHTRFRVSKEFRHLVEPLTNHRRV